MSYVGKLAYEQCGLAATLAQSPPHRVIALRPSPSIWQVTAELEADLVILLDQGHGWAHKLFSGSVIAGVLRYSQVPVLLLPLAA